MNGEGMYLSVNQVSVLLGRTASAVRNLCMRRKIPYRKAGGRLVFLAHEIQSWVEQGPGLKLEDLKKQ